MVFDIHVAGPADSGLVRRVHALLQQKFSADELDPLDEVLAIAAGTDPACRMLLAVAFHHDSSGAGNAGGAVGSCADQWSDRAIAGVCMWEYFVVPQCYLFTFFWVDEALNGRGLGVQLGLRCWNEAVKRRDARPPQGEPAPFHAIFAEVHRPDLAHEQENDMDPLERVEKLQHMGMRIVEDFDFYMPPLGGSRVFERYYLGSVVTPFTPLDADGLPVLPVGVVSSFVRSYYDLQLGDGWRAAAASAASTPAAQPPIGATAAAVLANSRVAAPRGGPGGSGGRAAADGDGAGDAAQLLRTAAGHLDAMLDSLRGRTHARMVKLDLRRYVVANAAAAHGPARAAAAAAVAAPQRAIHAPVEVPADGEVHVVVVGAGVAGLACAQRLTHAAAAAAAAAAPEAATPRLKVTVLEGRSRLGGRVHASRSHAVRVDLGAAWLHGLVGNAAYELQEDSRWRLFETDDTAVSMYAGRERALPMETLFRGSIKVEAFLQAFREHCSKNPQWYHSKDVETAMAEFYAAHPEHHAADEDEHVMFNYDLSSRESLDNTALRRMSLFNVAGPGGEDPECELAGGDQLVLDGAGAVVPNLLARGVAVTLNARVTHVNVRGAHRATVRFQQQGGPRWRQPPGSGPRRSGATAPATAAGAGSGDADAQDFEDRTADADYVVITVPVALLQDSNGDGQARADAVSRQPRAAIAFSPPLPARKQQAINRVGAGLFNKVILHFAAAFWEPDLQSHYIGFNLPLSADGELVPVAADLARLHRPRENIWFVNLMPSHAAPVLVAMVTGDLATRLQRLDDAAVVAHMLRVLGIMYGAAAVTKPINSMVTRWGLDPFAGMSYSYLRVGGSGEQDMRDYAAPCFGNTLLFAGEGTSDTRFGYLDGAIQTGWREADRILRAVGLPAPVPGAAAPAASPDEARGGERSRL